MDEGSRLLELAPTSLRPLLVRAADVAMRARTDVDVHVDAPEEVTVLADRQRLRQAVGNLLDNALRYAPPGSSVSVRLRAEDRPPGRVAVIEVADRGVGFAEQLPAARLRAVRAR